MLEFVRLMRARMHLGNETEITEEIQRLREKLERNRSHPRNALRRRA